MSLQIAHLSHCVPRFNSVPIDRCTRSILSPFRCATSRFRPRLFPRCKFRVGIKGDSRYGAVYASNVEEAVTRRVIPEQHVAPSSNLLSIGRPALREKEIRQRGRLCISDATWLHRDTLRDEKEI